MKSLKWLCPLAMTLLPGAGVRADSTDATCAVYPRGEDHGDEVMACTFSQRQGYVTIRRADGVEHELSPAGDEPGTFTDAAGGTVYRQTDLGDQGLIFRFTTESVYVYWSATMLEEPDEANPTWPFSTADYDATAVLRCKAPGADAFGSCPAGILRMESGEASIVVRDPGGEEFTINFMSNYVNATNREVEAQLDGDTWILHFANGQEWEVPIAAIEGG
jgi:hypothetical protein